MANQLGIDERARLDALAKWARRVVDHHDAPELENRRSPRQEKNVEMTMTPLDSETLRPVPEQSLRVIARDFSELGIGVVSNIPLRASLYFCEIADEPGVILVRQARERVVLGSIREYGFMTLDTYESFDDLRET